MQTAAFAVIIIIMMWISLQSLLYVAFLFFNLTEEDISREISIVNMVTSIIAVSTMLYLGCKYSGSPSRSMSWRHKLSKVNGAVTIWALTRFALGVFGIFNRFSEEGVSHYISNYNPGRDNLPLMIYIINLITSEII
jgi:hypothetical protein